jgi:hypothetical protein
MTDATPVYRAIVLELERRRIALGMSMERLSEVAGLADRAYSKMVHPEGRGGRVAQWQTLQRVVDALFPDGVDVAIKGERGRQLTALLARYHFNVARALNGKHIREHMSALAQRITREQRIAAYKKIPKPKRKEIARLGGIARARQLAISRKKAAQQQRASARVDLKPAGASAAPIAAPGKPSVVSARRHRPASPNGAQAAVTRP